MYLWLLKMQMTLDRFWGGFVEFSIISIWKLPKSRTPQTDTPQGLQRVAWSSSSLLGLCMFARAMFACSALIQNVFQKI